MKLRTFAIYAICGAIAGIVVSMGRGLQITPSLTAYIRRVASQESGTVPSQLRRTGRLVDPTPIHTALTLLWRAESSNGTDPNMGNGDGGLARGHFQHHKDAWNYGCKQLGVNWPYSDTDDLARAAAVIGACWSRQARQALEDGDVEMLVRKHRLPNAPMRADNDAYLERVMPQQ